MTNKNRAPHLPVYSTFAFAMLFLLLCLLYLLLHAPVSFANDSWYPSKYGSDDRLGAINELSPEGVLAAAKLIKTGKTYSLGVETGPATPAYGSRSFELHAVAYGDGSGAPLGKNQATFNDDWMLAWMGVGSQIDGLGHLGINHRYYNGVHVSEFYSATGLTQFGTHLLPPIVTRGVVLDIAGLKKTKRLPGGTPIGKAEIIAATKKQGIELHKGDVVLLHTGWQSLASEDPKHFLETEPGLDIDGARYLATKNVVAVGADTWGVDVLPNKDPEVQFPCHQILLAEHGIYILENMNTAALVSDQAWEFLFVLGQPKFVGAVQMVINPVAIR